MSAASAVASRRGRREDAEQSERIAFRNPRGVKHYLWRAVDHEGEVLESFVTKCRDKKVALNRRTAKRSLHKFAALHGSIHNHFNHERTLVSRQTFKDRRAGARAEWRQICAA